IQRRVQDALAVVAALALRLSEREVELGEAHLRAARLEKELVEAKMAVTGGGGSLGPTGPSTVSYASALKVSKKAAPVPIPAAQGPVLAFYPAPEHAEAFKSAEDTKAELKKSIRPQEIQLQVERLRKVGNAGVVVQTTSAAAAAKLREVTPATLRVTEPKRRAPLVSLRHVDGEGNIEELYPALHEQNFRGTDWSVERLRSQSRLAFKKRGRGTTTVVLECSPQLREALLVKGRVFLGWQVVEVCDFLSVTCCRKCHQYGHPEKYCRSAEVFCGRCGASGHRREECSGAEECCATCKRFGKLDASKHATISASCPARQYAEQRSIGNTNYGC
ncbi:jg25840, partial [Pararge aegeria aegeria]